MNLLRFVVTLLLVSSASSARAADWLTAPSYFTHDEQTGQRVPQYAESKPVHFAFDPTYVRSGFHHMRSSIRVGQSADHFHVVEEWGRPVRPYGEWRFPYRPYSVPYHLWGPPFAGLTIIPPWPYHGGYGAGYGGGGHPGVGPAPGSFPPSPFGAPFSP